MTNPLTGPVKPAASMEHLTGLDDFVNMTEAQVFSESGVCYGPVYDYAYINILRAKQYAKGGNPTGSPTNAAEAYAGMIENTRHLRFPWLLGQRVTRFGPRPQFKVGHLMSNLMELGAVSEKTRSEDRETPFPINPDIWYLVISQSLLPSAGEGFEEKVTKILGFLNDYLVKLDNIKTLLSVPNKGALVKWGGWGDHSGLEDALIKVIRTMRFETWICYEDSKLNTEFPSKGPVATRPKDAETPAVEMVGKLYAGFIAFPVGPPGAMEVLSIYSESMILRAKDYPLTPDGVVRIDWPDGWACVTAQSMEGFMSPMTDMSRKCPGVHVVENGYITTSDAAEYPSSRIDVVKYPLYNKEHQDLRYYFRRDARWPIPGEFIGLLAKPFPNHVWWFQKTSPFLYSGNWFETNHYTSGVVTGIVAPLDGAKGVVYKCKVRGLEIYIATSDFYGYSIGARVAILRIPDINRSVTTPLKGTYKWGEMEDLLTREETLTENPTGLDYDIHTGLLILPIEFYKITPEDEAKAITQASTLAAAKEGTDAQARSDAAIKVADVKERREELESRIDTAKSNAISEIILARTVLANEIAIAEAERKARDAGFAAAAAARAATRQYNK